MDRSVTGLLEEWDVHGAVSVGNKTIVPVNDENKREIAKNLRMVLATIRRHQDFGKANDFVHGSIIPVYDNCTFYFPHRSYKVRVPIRNEFVIGSPTPGATGPTWAAHPTLMLEDHIFPRFFEPEIPGVLRHRISIDGSFSFTTDANDIPYFIECTPLRGVRPDVIETKLRFMYS
jgi:hypothetical protein